MCAHLSCKSPSGTGGPNNVSLEPSLLQAEQPQLSQPSLTGEVFQPYDHFCGLLWTRSHRSMSLLCWGLQNWIKDSRWGLTRVEQRGGITSLNLLVMRRPTEQTWCHQTFWQGIAIYWWCILASQAFTYRYPSPESFHRWVLSLQCTCERTSPFWTSILFKQI